MVAVPAEVDRDQAAAGRRRARRHRAGHRAARLALRAGHDQPHVRPRRWVAARCSTSASTRSGGTSSRSARPDSVAATGMLAATGVDDQAVVALGYPRSAGPRDRQCGHDSRQPRHDQRHRGCDPRARVPVARADSTCTARAASSSSTSIRPGSSWREGLCWQAAAIAQHVADGRTEAPEHSAGTVDRGDGDDRRGAGRDRVRLGVSDGGGAGRARIRSAPSGPGSCRRDVGRLPRRQLARPAAGRIRRPDRAAWSGTSGARG